MRHGPPGGISWCAPRQTGALGQPRLPTALRLHFFDQGGRGELIREGAYNGIYRIYGNMTEGQFHTSGVGDNFYRHIAGNRVTSATSRR